ncbi:TonB-dependent siderophore receptor [Orrella dioscoreae]|uniref:TonB-dependent siderophore receptor n=1 Tax=Orrella dioscoreae TaxID=1851544 RepID=UPI000833E3FD|nr:TonB-dependent siderophore receptor [Orrella dioscoreae]
MNRRCLRPSRRFAPLAACLGVLAASSAFAQSQAPAQLAPVLVRGGIDQSPELGDTYAATRSRSASKTDTALSSTTQAVNVVTRTEMERQGSTSVAQALRYTPGVTAQYGDTDARHDWLTVRGFTPGRYLDGLLLPFGARGYSQPRLDTYALERIEVLKGPSSGLYGQTSPGGTVAMTSKRPTAEPLREIVVQGGSFDRYRGSFDLGGPADAEGRLLYRLTGLIQESNSSFDTLTDDKRFFAPSLTWRFSADTSLNLSAQFQETHSRGGGGAPALPVNGVLWRSSAGDIPRERYVGDPDFDRFHNEQLLLGYTLDHRINDRASFRQTARYSEVDTHTQRVQIGLMATEKDAVRYAWRFPERSRVLQIDNQLDLRLRTGPVSHALLLGLDYLQEDSRFEESALTLFMPPSYPLFDLQDPRYDIGPIASPAAAMKIRQRRDQLGVYAQNLMSYERWQLTLAGRYDRTDATTRTWRAASSTWSRVDTDPGRLTGRVGLAYQFDSGITPYASYATSFQPVMGTDRNGGTFSPTTGKQLELGVKYVSPDQRLVATAAAFQLDQKNVSAPDPLNTSFSVQTGKVRIRGVELEAKANFDAGWAVTAGYAYTQSEIQRTNAGNTNGQAGNALAFVPRHQASLWLDKTLQEGPLAGLGAGFGLSYRGSTYGDNANRYAIPAVTLADAALRLDLARLNPTWRGADLALNVNNVFDKKYVTTCLGPVACYWGAERTVMATARYRW